MNLIKYVSAMKKLDSTTALIGILVLCLFLIILIAKMYFGMRRGFKRQVVCTITTVVSMLASVIIASVLSEQIIGKFDAHIIEDLVVKIEGVVPKAGEFLRKTIVAIEPAVFESIFLLPATLLLIPIVATVCFILLNLIFKIVRLIVIKVMKMKKAQNNFDRLGGTLLAAVEGIICVMMFLLPFAGVVSLVDRAYDEAISSRYADENSELERINEEFLSPFTDNPAFTFVNGVGGTAISDSIATVEINNEKVNLRHEVVNITGIVMAETTTLKDADLGDLTNYEKSAIENIINGVCKSSYMTHITSGAIRSSRVVLNFNIIKYDENSELADIIDGLVGYFETVTDSTLEEDLTTMKEILFTVSDSGAVVTLREGDSDLWTVLQDQRKAGDDTISKLVDILQRNERASCLVKTFTEVLIASLATEVVAPDGTVVTVTYDELKDSMSTVLDVHQRPGETYQEYMDNLSSTLDTTFKDHGINLEEEIVYDIAEYIDSKYEGKNDLTDEEFNDVLLHYYDAYLDYVENGNVPEEFK